MLMKKLIMLPILLSTLISCEKGPEDATIFFEALGIEIDVRTDDICMEKQLMHFYDQASDSDNTEKLVSFIKNNKLNKISIGTRFERPVECDQVMIDRTEADTSRFCDPGTLNTVLIELARTQTFLDSGVFGLTTHAQEINRTVLMYKFPNIKDDFLEELKEDITRTTSDSTYLSMNDINPYLQISPESTVEYRKIPSEFLCGEMIDLEIIFSTHDYVE